MLDDFSRSGSGSTLPSPSGSSSGSSSPVSSDSCSLSPESRQKDFWFEDGSVILLADTIAFKVHRGQLARHSDVFRDLLSIPQPQDEASFEGCYIVELHDSPEDLWYLLKALYDGLYFRQLCASDFGSLAAILRLSSKYFIEHLRERCISRLMIDWPCTLASWDSREVEATDALGRYSPRSRFAHPILVINFAREIGLSSLLPSAFYDLCRYGPSKIVAGVVQHRNNGPIKARPGATISNTATTTRLSLDDLRTALLGRERAQRIIASFIEEELSNREPSSDCHNRDSAGDNGRSCRESFYFIMLNLLRAVGGLSSGRDCDPLFSLTQAAEMMNRSDFSDGTTFCSLKLCVACRTEFAQSVKAARERVWLQIPSWFGMADFTGASAKPSTP
ncbi:uncharacterized protein FOMMEDRAFT_89795 [Fomitiporia mediterranea MF3/22]|uniref:uncharacterized protein n=1 Tax=Fomitiporia mediterranea (strain MF3/22) TaxID=694068 RepID=UPI00044097C4|nr:uncharacterized protein FOMMEDRAFT_89795 [Fomitiporia mediterranea MF3/22]EJD00814.1 hypothetical protein FOMMEDRAFT_89795 [Fomitiporia mediterranea MF3/22]